MIVSFHLLCCLCGLVLYGYFRYCDPMTSSNRPIHSADQLMPYFIAITLGHLPGIPGLCICGIFSASLSTVSSAINSLASVATEDFIRPLFPKINVTSFHAKIMKDPPCMGLLHTKSYVVSKRPPAGVVWKFGEELPAHVSCSSSDRCS
ncbi:hypothetical protein AVEN_177841-1 [Araneus ventricosus]|uniref:Sodium-coupled monocarboxylate transporter 1 n=1 Tax=Araneus ventricosus TaxID=182803 RepID=A0A4Y1ZLC0_ARAVE|nr:hypothetical protein AVEN_177841-1 [Araneus ventricosus]